MKHVFLKNRDRRQKDLTQSGIALTYDSLAGIWISVSLMNNCNVNTRTFAFA